MNILRRMQLTATAACLIAAASLVSMPAHAVLKSAGAVSGGGGGSGTVTSVGVTMPSVFAVSSSPVTTAGTIGVTFAAGQAGNLVLASPDGTTGAVGLRALVFSDLPAGLATLNSFNIFTVGQEISDAEPQFLYNETDQGTDLKLWDWDVQGGVFSGRTRTDAAGTGVNWLTVTRGTTTTVSDISLGSTTGNPSFHILGTGAETFGGAATFSNTLTAANTFTLSSTSTAILNNSGAIVVYRYIETDQGTDLKRWTTNVNNAVWSLVTTLDNDNTGKTAMAVTRGTTTAIADISFGNATDNNTTQFLGTGLVTMNGQLQPLGVNVTSSAVPFTGIYRAGTGILGFGANGQGRGRIDGVGLYSGAGYQVNGTKYTTTGCSVSATVGAATGGNFTLGANSCSVVVTMGQSVAATTGWVCTAHDRTAPTVLIGGESASTTTTATIAIPITAGTTDVISFACIGY